MTLENWWALSADLGRNWLHRLVNLYVTLIHKKWTNSASCVTVPHLLLLMMMMVMSAAGSITNPERLSQNLPLKGWPHNKTALGKTSIAVHQWTTKQFWVDRQFFKQENNVYCLEKVQINKLNVYLKFKLNYDVCYTYESCLYIFPTITLNWHNFLAITYYCVIFISALLQFWSMINNIVTYS
jgi:hypothetical protein